MLFVKAQSANTDSTIENRQAWIQSLLSEHGNPINCNDYIFYCTGHHGIIWSLITSDSSGISLYNGTTRKHIDYGNQRIPDTLSFIKNNIKTISWGIDSLPNTAQLFVPFINSVYNPIYCELDVIKDGNISFSYNNAEVFYNGADSIDFRNKLNKLTFLMLWLAAPSIRQYLPCPSDTLLLK
ncbi:MAG: hypothetical protein K2J38_03075 [Muribaculaceae bacterium]|nr:hypothetical protein [Muribaculaceae bacterium]